MGLNFTVVLDLATPVRSGCHGATGVCVERYGSPGWLPADGRGRTMMLPTYRVLIYEVGTPSAVRHVARWSLVLSV